MQSKARFPNVIFGASLRPEGAALAILLMLLFLVFALLFITLTVQTSQAQVARNAVPPTAREAAASPAFASKLHPSTRPTMSKPQAAARARTGRASPQGQVIYENGPVNGTTDAWTINFGYIVSDSFSGYSVGGFDIWVWEFSGDVLRSVDWSITSGPNSGTVYGSGTASGANLTDTFISSNQFGYDIDEISVSGLNVSPGSGTFWLNVQNAVVPSGDPVFWDENSGVGCHSPGCPSQAYERQVGTIPSEAFDINTGGPPPPPCFSSSGNMQIIHDFTGKGDGSSPSGVAANAAGNVYGAMTTRDTGFGLVYEIASENQGWLFNILYSFTGGANGSLPSTPTLGPGGVLYGTASGGIPNCSGGFCGLVYSLRPAPTACLTSLCSWTESALYQPTGNNDAYDPGTLVFDQAGNLYGTSAQGGAYGQGAVFELTPSPGGWTENVLYSFTGGSNGSGPTSLLVGKDGDLYGSAGAGGAYGYGVVFQLVRPPSGYNWTENVIYAFTGQSDGGGPYSLVQDGLGSFLGIASRIYNNRPSLEVFMLSLSNGSWVFSEPFLIVTDDNSWSASNLAADAAGNVYWAYGYEVGCQGADCNSPDYIPECEVIMRPPGGDFSTLWDAGDHVFFPGGALAVDANRNVYGTTVACGQYGNGTVWMVTH